MNEKDQYIIEQYKQQENVMILLFAQWCVNYDLNPTEIYQKAYPNQPISTRLLEALDQTVPKKEADDIDRELLLDVLQAYGNDDLAFEVAQIKIEK
ncbi:hypothetical protein SAMN05421734_10551 [Pelagirhabdus alkalitolerans]|uniref:Uncharacterized protein n=1 Tax=Pelagirhabdus alkalitolerans TaxID=1612202 RepID=A0A1G6JKC8_9BACI|nr:hypothetical protein [Pelagirhabdus alkalitolerans]SDC18406.1 hypothetical protein SAMN05421734_10551 [Pelagirhabdus alkalitolerans]